MQKKKSKNIRYFRKNVIFWDFLRFLIFLVLMLLFISVDRFFVSRMPDFFNRTIDWIKTWNKSFPMPIIKNNQIYHGCQKNAGHKLWWTTFLKSRGQGPNTCIKVQINPIISSFFFTFFSELENNDTLKCLLGIFPTTMSNFRIPMMYMIIVENGRGKKHFN